MVCSLETFGCVSGNAQLQFRARRTSNGKSGTPRRFARTARSDGQGRPGGDQGRRSGDAGVSPGRSDLTGQKEICKTENQNAFEDLRIFGDQDFRLPFGDFLAGSLPPGSDLTNSRPTLGGIPSVLFPAFAAYMARLCASLLGGIVISSFASVISASVVLRHCSRQPCVSASVRPP